VNKQNRKRELIPVECPGDRASADHQQSIADGDGAESRISESQQPASN
jgi:hypothetical protein